MKVSIEDIYEKQPKQFFTIILQMWDYQCLTILRHTFTDLILGTEVVKWTSSNIYKIRIYYFFGTTFMISCHSSPSRGTRHSFGFSRQEAERICPQFPIFRFPDKRHRLYRGFFHTFLIFGRKSNTDVCEHKNSDPDQKSCQLKPIFLVFLGLPSFIRIFLSRHVAGSSKSDLKVFRISAISPVTPQPLALKDMRGYDQRIFDWILIFVIVLRYSAWHFHLYLVCKKGQLKLSDKFTSAFSLN